jgi:hypothetical protein
MFNGFSAFVTFCKLAEETFNCIESFSGIRGQIYNENLSE